MSSMPMRDPDFPVPSQFHSKRKLQKGDALITEISGAYSGYSGQIHRTFSIGEGPTPEWQKMHDAAMEAFEALSKVIKDGATTTEAEEAAEIIHRRGYSTYDDLVHGVNQYPPIFQTKTRKRHDSREMIFPRKHGDRHPTQSHDLRRKNGPAVRRDSGGEEKWLRIAERLSAAMGYLPGLIAVSLSEPRQR